MHQINWLLKSEEWLLVCWCVSTAPQCCLYVVVLWLYFIYITTFLLLLPWFRFCIWPNCNFDIISVNCSAPLCVIAAMYLRRRREEFIMVCVVCVVCCVCVMCVSCVLCVCRVCCVSCVLCVVLFVIPGIKKSVFKCSVSFKPFYCVRSVFYQVGLFSLLTFVHHFIFIKPTSCLLLCSQFYYCAVKPTSHYV